MKKLVAITLISIMFSGCASGEYGYNTSSDDYSGNEFFRTVAVIALFPFFLAASQRETLGTASIKTDSGTYRARTTRSLSTGRVETNVYKVD